MKHFYKAIIMVVITLVYLGCQKTIEYKQTQTVISDFKLPYKNFGEPDFEITPPASNSPEPFTYTSSNTNVAEVVGTTVKIKNAGVTTITATQKASNEFTQLAISADLNVGLSRPKITDFPDIVKVATDGVFLLPTPKSNSKGTFTYTIDKTDVATISGNKVTIKAAGTATITAHQAISGNYGLGSIVAKLTINNPNEGTVTDVDGNVYKTTKIGTQTWMMENLKVKHYRDGSIIPNITESGAWRSTNSGAFCSFNNDAANAKTYGLLYNWFAVTDARKLAPKGWHIPTEAEWQVLYKYIGGTREDGRKLQEKGTTHWFGDLGTNETKFTGLGGGGLIFGVTNIFDDFNFDAYWWSATAKDGSNAAYVDLYTKGYFEFKSGYIRYGLSVRCIKD